MADTEGAKWSASRWFAASSILAAVLALVHRLRLGARIVDRDKKALQLGLDCYDPENRVFPRIFKKARKGQPLTKREVLLILKWKLNRTKGSFSKTVSDANLTKINQAIRMAGKSGREVEALNVLDEIPEIGLRVATTILTVCYPKKYTILDWRVLEMIGLLPSTIPEDKRNVYIDKHWTASKYLAEYLPAVDKRRKQWRCTLRNADRGLWGLSVANKIDQVIVKSHSNLGSKKKKPGRGKLADENTFW